MHAQEGCSSRVFFCICQCVYYSLDLRDGEFSKFETQVGDNLTLLNVCMYCMLTAVWMVHLAFAGDRIIFLMY